MAGTLGQQVRSQNVSSQQFLGRTQRKLQQDQYSQQQRVAQEEYDKLKAQAEEVRSTIPADISIEDYAKFYSGLDPKLQPFFQTADEIRSQREQYRTEQQTQVQQTISEKTKELEKRREQFDVERQQKMTTAEWKKTQDAFEEETAYIQVELEKLGWGLTELQSGKLYSAGDIESFAGQYGSYKQTKQEQRNFENKLKQMQVKESVQVEDKNALTIKEFQEKNPTEQLIFDAQGNVVAIRSGKLGGVNISIAGYNDPKTWENFAVNQWKATKPEKEYYLPKDLTTFDYSKIRSTTTTMPMKISPPTERPPSLASVISGANIVKGVVKGWKWVDDRVHFDITGGVIPSVSAYSKKPVEPRLEGTDIPSFKFMQSPLPKNFPFEQEIKTTTPEYTISNDLTTFDYSKTRSTINVMPIKITPPTEVPSFLSTVSRVGKAVPQLKITFGKREKPTIVESVVDVALKSLDETQKNLGIKAIGGQEKYDKFLQQQQERNQRAFEERYMEDIIRGKTTFEQASQDWQKSETYKLIQQKSQEEYAKMQRTVPFVKGMKYGLSEIGLDFAKLGVSAVRSPTRVATATALVYTGSEVLSAIPPSLNYAINLGFFAKGTYDVLDQTKTYKQRAGGLLTAGITGASLGYSTYRYLRSPVIKPTAIPSPKQTLKSYAVGQEQQGVMLKTGGELKSAQEVIYKTQKLSQIGVAGRRTVVTTKWRDLLNRYLGTKLKPIYRGIPTQQRELVYSIEGLRGKYNIQVEPSAYQKAVKLLKDYGYTPSQAKSTLRFYAPKVVEQVLKEGRILVMDQSAYGRFKFETSQPVLNVDETLGIKTRGAKTIKETIDFQRKIEGATKSGDIIVSEYGVKTNLAKTLGKTTETYAQVSVIRAGEIYDVGIPTRIKEILLDRKLQTLESVYFRKNVIPMQREWSRGGSRVDIIKAREMGGEPRIVDLDEQGGITFTRQSANVISPQKIVKTPFSRTFGTDEGVKEVKKAVDKMKFAEPSSDLNYGSQLSNVPQQTAPTITSEVKSIIKNIVKQKNLLNLGSGSAVAVKSVSRQQSSLREGMSLKSNLKLQNVLKSELKLNLQERTIEKTKQTHIQPQRLRSILLQQAPNFTTTPQRVIIKIPPIKPINTRVVPFIFGGDELEKVRKRIKKKKSIENFALFPDFTARSIGLEPKQFGSVEEALMEIKGIKTGFEVRTGGTFRKVNEKNLMKGIMK